MTALLLQYLKLIILFALVGSIIGLSHFKGENGNGSGVAAAPLTHGRPKAHTTLVLNGRLAAAAEDAAFVPPYPTGAQHPSSAPIIR